MEINRYKKYVRSFGYMSVIDRNSDRQKITQEFFTPFELVSEVLDRVENSKPTLFTDPTTKIIDNACGDGQFLTEVVIRKMENGIDLKQALRTTYGVELMEDNVQLCKERLAGPDPDEEIWEILDKNIVCHDALTYDYSFGNPVGIEKWLEMD